MPRSRIVEDLKVKKRRYSAEPDIPIGQVETVGFQFGLSALKLQSCFQLLSLSLFLS